MAGLKFKIPRQNFYDMLGREVESIVNSFQQAGSYKAVFTGENLTSGVYLYKLSSGSFVETKKMILVK